ncbi:MAG: PmoA family protein [Prolixibacteraceae bacterium]|jgi:hypothetical protein|nr:PmoA family protein [Prolixibacteraceae bacterium]
MQKTFLFTALFFTCSFASAQISMVIGDGGFLFKEGGDSICFYQRSPKSLNGEYSRCNYFHPLYGLDGAVLTEDFPEDHPHHRGIFWSWHQVLIDGQSMGDPWMLENFIQKVKNVQFEQLRNGDATFNTEVYWMSPLYKNGKEAYLKEQSKTYFFLKEKNLRRIDFEITLSALTDKVQLGGSNDEKGYGGFSVRLRLPEDVMFRCEENIVSPEVIAVSVGACVDISGSMGKNNSYAGAAIICDENNPGFPQSWILRKEKSMQNVVYPGKKPVDLLVGEPLVLKYSILVHDKEISKRAILKEGKKPGN